MDLVFRKELLKLGKELGGQSFIVGQDQGGFAGILNQVGHGEGLARAGYTHQCLVLLAPQNSVSQCGNGGRLVTGRLILGM